MSPPVQHFTTNMHDGVCDKYIFYLNEFERFERVKMCSISQKVKQKHMEKLIT